MTNVTSFNIDPERDLNAYVETNGRKKKQSLIYADIYLRVFNSLFPFQSYQIFIKNAEYVFFLRHFGCRFRCSRQFLKIKSKHLYFSFLFPSFIHNIFFFLVFSCFFFFFFSFRCLFFQKFIFLFEINQFRFCRFFLLFFFKSHQLVITDWNLPKI